MHLLVSLYIGNALLVRNSILGYGESILHRLTLTFCSSVLSKNKRTSLQRSLQIMLSTALPNFGCLLTSSPHPFWSKSSLLVA